MGAFRHLIGRRIAATWVLIALTLAMKLVVAVGFMPSMTAAGLQIIVCTGMGPAGMPMATTGHESRRTGGHQAPAPSKADTPCIGAGLSAPVLGGADPIQHAIALAAAIVAELLLVMAPPNRPIAFLRPHPRGPPRPA